MLQPDIPSEEEASIQFFAEDVDFVPGNTPNLIYWIERSITEEGKQLESISYIFCSDAYLHEINVSYLQHDTYTDIITFPYHSNPIEGDIFISIDRVKENAITYGVGFEDELHRVMIHGVMHLCGYKDKTSAEKKQMSAKENEYLAKLKDLKS